MSTTSAHDPFGTFDPEHPESAINIVRQMIGDMTPPYIIGDATILYFQSIQPVTDASPDPDVYVTAIYCLDIIAGAYAQLADKTVGDLSITYRQQYTQIMTLIARFKEQRDFNWSMAFKLAPTPIFSGTSRVDMMNGHSGVRLRNDPPDRHYWT